ncbi:MAG: hypothetical protein KIS86_13465 [Devosia sp.]|nr:hypothetical protein [Devosia sp.]
MKQSDIALLMKGIAPVIAELVQKSAQPLVARIAELEQVIADLPAPKEVDEAEIASRAASAAADIVRPMVDDLRKGIEALSEAPELPNVAEMIKEAALALEDQRAEDAAQIKSWMDGVDERLDALPKSIEPKEFNPEDVRGVVVEEAARAVAALPAPQDGKSVTIEDIAPLIERAVAKAVAGIRVPADGVGLAGAVQDHKGNLIITLTNGGTVDVGQVAGKDADMDAILAKIKELVDAIPKPQDGVDGLGFDGMDMVIGDDGVALKFTLGDKVKAFALPVPFYRGVYSPEKSYRKGNTVTWGGSLWIALKDNPKGKPDAPDSDWVLSVKKGQNAK